MTSPSGRQIELVAGDYDAVVVQVGGGLRTLEYAGRPLLEGYPADAMADAGRGQLLLPWPNRIGDGKYRFDGQDYQLDLSEPARSNAIHGLTRWAPWEVTEAARDHARLSYRLWPRPGYPHLLDLEVTYRLDPRTGLRVAVSATNSGADPAPYAAGAHPYLTAGTATVDACELTLPAAVYLEIDEQMLPTGRGNVQGTDLDFRSARVIGDTKLDTCFTDIRPGEDGVTTVALRAPGGQGTALWFGTGQPYVQVFTGDALPPEQRRTGLAVEPMTAPPNAFATGEDVVVLDVGQTHSVEWGITAIPV
jgi:aldose 1-epimerase